MDEEFDFLKKGFEKLNIDYWLDHGSLLGIVREGKFMKSDGDLDVSTWWAEVKNNIDELINYFNNNGYQARIYSYNNTPFKIKLLNKGSYPIDINIYKKTENFAWQPAIRLSPLETVDNNLLFSKIRILPYFTLSLIWRVLFVGYGTGDGIVKRANLDSESGIINELVSSDKNIHISIDSIPYNYFSSIGTWLIPRRFFSSTSFYDQIYPVPSSYVDYLEFRYGNWRTPVSNWSTWHDDGGLINTPPSNVF